MFNYKIKIQYDGSRYRGWQRLGSTSNTIQNKIEMVLSEMANEKIEIIGSSRTDAGVHAYSQIANFKISNHMNPKDMKAYLNRYLPHDISIIDVELANDNFHSRYNVKSKTYRYQIWNKEYSNPFCRKYSMHVKDKLQIELMVKASRHFIGKHDFTAFTNAKSKSKSMIREIYDIEIYEDSGMIHIIFNGDGFLYNMIRRIVGIMIQVGLSNVDDNEIPNIIQSKLRKNAPYIAEPNGLILEDIRY